MKHNIEWVEHGNVAKVFSGTDFIGVIIYLNRGDWCAIDPVGRFQGVNWNTAHYAADALSRVYRGN